MSKDETIKIKHKYFEEIHTVSRKPETRGKPMLTPTFESLMDKDVFPEEFKPRYWLSRILDRVTQELNHYLDGKLKLLRKHTVQYEKAGEEKKDGKVIRKWKKGDIKMNPDGTPVWKDFEAYQKELEEFQDDEVDLGFKPIVCDWSKGPNVTQKEMQIIWPFLAEPQEPQEPKGEQTPPPGDKKKKKHG